MLSTEEQETVVAATLFILISITPVELSQGGFPMTVDSLDCFTVPVTENAFLAKIASVKGGTFTLPVLKVAVSVCV